MRTHKRFVGLGSYFLVGLLVVAQPACGTWQAVGPTPQEYLAAHHPDAVRLTRLDSSQVVLRTPTVRADSLVGLIGGGMRQDDPERATGVPLGEIQLVEARRGGARNFLIGYAVVAGLATLVFVESGGVMGD